jgi:N-acetylglucosamine-6-phosphate deacetylase
MGVDNERGVLTSGARADLVALTGELSVIMTWIGGVSA